MVYQIRYSPHAVRDLKILPEEVQAWIVTALDILMENPRTHAKRLTELPLFSFRTGGYRVILSIEDNNSVIRILKIGKRDHVYERL